MRKSESLGQREPLKEKKLEKNVQIVSWKNGRVKIEKNDFIKTLAVDRQFGGGLGPWRNGCDFFH